MLPDITGLQEYASSQVAAVLFIIMCFILVRAFLEQRWGRFISAILFAGACWLIISNPESFESLVSGLWDKVKSGGLS